MRAFVRVLLLRAKPASVVFIHDGLLVSPEPSSADIDACLHKASLALDFVPPPVFRVRATNLVHDCSLRQRGTSNHLVVQKTKLLSCQMGPKFVGLPQLLLQLKHCTLFGHAVLAHNRASLRFVIVSTL